MIKEKSEQTSKEGSATSKTNDGAMRLIPAEYPDESALVSEIIDKTGHIIQNNVLNKVLQSYEQKVGMD